MNSEQIRVLWQALFSASGPIAAILVQQFGLAPGKVEAWLSLIGLLTPVLGAAWMAASRTNKAQVQAVANMPNEEKSTAVASLSVPAQASIAASLSDTAVAAAVATLPVEAQQNIATAAVASMPVEAQGKVADAMADETKIAAVTALPDVKNVVVEPTSQNGVGNALANPNEPKVIA